MTPTPEPKQKQDSAEPQTLVCEWQDPPCSDTFTDPEVLYHHLCDHHIGRKSTGNLTLRCKWKNCEVECVKRDHITSHLRVHTPLKPHNCPICQKAFKRPQDLKKHERIHTEEHHIQHKHSKAITVQRTSISAGPDGFPRAVIPIPHHAAAQVPTSNPPTAAAAAAAAAAQAAQYHYAYGQAQATANGYPTSGLSTAQLVQQQHEMNAQTALHTAAQAAAQQAYQQVLLSSGLAASGYNYSTDASAHSAYAAYPHYAAALQQSYGPHYQHAYAAAMAAAAAAATQQQQATVAASPAAAPRAPSLYPDLAALNAAAHHQSSTALMPSVTALASSSPSHSSRGPSPLPAQVDQAIATLPRSHVGTSSPSTLSAVSAGVPLAQKGGLLGGSNGTSNENRKKRSFDEAAQEVLEGLKKGRFSDGDMDPFDRLSRVLLSPAPPLEQGASSSGSSGSAASSPHSSGAASNTPPSDFDWLGDRAEADKLTDLLASIGSNLEASTANPNWASDFQFPSFEPQAGSTAAPKATEADPVPSFTPAPRAGEREASSSVYPSLAALTAAPASSQHPTSYSQILAARGYEPHVRVARPLAPPQIAPFEGSHRPTLHTQTPLQRAPPTSSVRNELMEIDASEEPGAKYAESIRSTSVKLPPLASRAYPTLLDPEPKEGTADMPRTSSTSTSGLTLPSLRSLFSEIPSHDAAASSSSPPPARSSVMSTTSSSSTGHSAYPSLAGLRGEHASRSPTPSTRARSASSTERPMTAESLSGRVHSLGLTRASSPAPDPLAETSDDVLDDTDNTAVPHKRTRRSSMRSDSQPPANQLDEVSRNRLAVVHALIVKVNEIHRAVLARKAGEASIAASVPSSDAASADEAKSVQQDEEQAEGGETPTRHRSASPMNEDS